MAGRKNRCPEKKEARKAETMMNRNGEQAQKIEGIGNWRGNWNHGQPDP